MTQIANLNLYVGTKEEYSNAIAKDMKIVCALNRASNYVTHQSAVGWTGRGCNPDHPYYLYKETEEAIYLNMIDGNNPKYISDTMINPALAFIDRHLQADNSVFIYCSLGESRSPSIALMYLLEHNLIKKENALIDFQDNYYLNYYPKDGVRLYIENRWLKG